MALARKLRIGLFDALHGQSDVPGFALSDDEKNRSGRQALLGLASGLLGTGGGFGNALGAGLQNGLLALNQSADDVVNDRYRQQMMQRTMAGMDRNNQLQQLQGQLANPDGSINQEKFRQFAAMDPQAAKAYRDAVQPQQEWHPVEITDPSNPGNVISVMHDGRGNYLYPDRTPVFGGGGEQAAQTGGLLGQSPGLGSTPAIGILQPEQLQADYTQLASAYPGTQISSRTRTPERNKAVGGVANSQHLSGTAADFVVPAAARPQFIADARKRGYEAIDEGDHVHLELPPNRNSSAQAGRGASSRFSRPRYAPKDAASTERYRVMSPAEVKALGLPEGTVAQQGPTGQVQIVNKPRDLPSGQPELVQNDDGTVTVIPAGKTSEDERKAAGFYSRMTEASKTLQALTDDNYDPSNIRDRYTAGGDWANYLASDQGQQYYQAAANWVRANLRKESGAVIGKDEMDREIKNYFPQPGDRENVQKQKEQNRKTVEQAMRTQAGRALQRTIPAANAAPKPGEVKKGYRFKGGDPASPNSWEKI